MKAPLKLIVCTAAAAMLSATAFAQNQPSPSSGGSQQTPPTGTETHPGAGHWGGMEGRHAGGQFYEASNILNRNAKSAQGETLGKVKDVAFNPRGRAFALIDVGNNKYAAVPWALINPSTAQSDKGDLTINTTKQALQSAPTLTKDQFSNLNDPNFARQLYSHYGQAAGMGGTGMGGTGGQSGEQEQSQPEQQQ